MNNKLFSIVTSGLLSVLLVVIFILHFADHSNLVKTTNQVSSLEKTIASLQAGLASLDTSQASSPVDQNAVSAVMTEVKASVVRINTTGTGFVGSGSGFLVDNAGYILTNNHVVDGANSINVSLSDNTSYLAQVMDTDASRDLALLKLESTRLDFSMLHFELSTPPQDGVQVLLAGFPLGLELSGPVSFSRGIISASRVIDGLNYIQTDAAINPGNSGGPLVDLAGKAVGVCTGKVTSQTDQVVGLGLAIPISDAFNFITQGHVPCNACHEIR